MHYVYILQSSKRNNWLYKGSTSDLKRRVVEHNSGKNFSTAPYKFGIDETVCNAMDVFYPNTKI